METSAESWITLYDVGFECQGELCKEDCQRRTRRVVFGRLAEAVEKVNIRLMASSQAPAGPTLTVSPHVSCSKVRLKPSSCLSGNWPCGALAVGRTRLAKRQPLLARERCSERCTQLVRPGYVLLKGETNTKVVT